MRYLGFDGSHIEKAVYDRFIYDELYKVIELEGGKYKLEALQLAGPDTTFRIHWPDKPPSMFAKLFEPGLVGLLEAEYRGAEWVSQCTINMFASGTKGPYTLEIPGTVKIENMGLMKGGGPYSPVHVNVWLSKRDVQDMEIRSVELMVPEEVIVNQSFVAMAVVEPNEITDLSYDWHPTAIGGNGTSIASFCFDSIGKYTIQVDVTGPQNHVHDAKDVNVVSEKEMADKPIVDALNEVLAYNDAISEELDAQYEALRKLGSALGIELAE